MYGEVKRRPVYVVAERLGVSLVEQQVRTGESDQASPVPERPRLASN
jgi:hypothetical protein